MRIFRTFILVVTVFCCFSSCKHRNQKANDNFQKPKTDIKIDFPQSLTNLSFNSKKEKTKFTIVVYYDGNCATCYFQLLKWRDFIEKNKKNHLQTQFKFILSSYSIAVLKANLEDINFPLENVYHDKNDDFINKYEFLLNDDYTNSSMLLDEFHRVLYIGNPTISKTDKDKFIKLINELK